jgi:hypothetical protein
VVGEGAVELGVDEGLEDFLAVDEDREGGVQLIVFAGVGEIAGGGAEDAL